MPIDITQYSNPRIAERGIDILVKYLVEEKGCLEITPQQIRNDYDLPLC
ncbi:MAG: hypothetical protein O2779_03150 [Nanoarchaeota archaeon]|nr:hypothetical protein [Nanoarchaeota archaeon]